MAHTQLLCCVVIITLVTIAGAAPVEWPVAEGGNGHFYEAVLVPDGISWHDAKAAAESAGGYLATITSQEENNFVFNLINYDVFWRSVPANLPAWSASFVGPWLGGFQPEGSSEPRGDWQWGTGEPFSYANWDIMQPDNYPIFGDQDYLHFGWQPLRASKWDDSWDNQPPFVPISYVIEIPEPVTLSLLGLGGLALLKRRGA